MPLSPLCKLSTAVIILHLVLKSGTRRRDKDHHDSLFLFYHHTHESTCPRMIQEVAGKLAMETRNDFRGRDDAFNLDRAGLTAPQGRGPHG